MNESMQKIIAIASDHNGFSYKGHLIKHLQKLGYHVNDLGTNSEDRVDYPDFGKLVCSQITEQDAHMGILICGTGIGMSIVANRYSSVRAALCVNENMAEKARLHNDANVIIFGANNNSKAELIKMLYIFLATSFEGGRHSSRLNKIG